jgi:hypothetical protein
MMLLELELEEYGSLLKVFILVAAMHHLPFSGDTNGHARSPVNSLPTKIRTAQFQSRTWNLLVD